jgi:signal transduction histidine kinase
MSKQTEGEGSRVVPGLGRFIPAVVELCEALGAGGVVLEAGTGRILLVSPKAAELLDLGDQPAVAQDFAAPAGATTTLGEQGLRAWASSEQTRTAVWTSSRQQRTVRATALTLSEGDRRRRVVVLEDISELCRLRLEVERLRAAPHGLQSSADACLAPNAALHDMNNMVTGAVAELELLQVELQQLPAAAARVRSVICALCGAAGLARRAARTEPALRNAEGTDLNALVVSLQGSMRVWLGGRAELNLALDSDLPPVSLDRDSLERVMLNLLSNARDATSEGDCVTVSSRLRREDGSRWVSLSVTDTGTGMDRETAERALAPLFTTKEQGTGLGLAVVKQLVQSAGGSVTVNSEPGRGTEVRVDLPTVGAQRPHVARDGMLPESDPSSDETPGGTP